MIGNKINDKTYIPLTPFKGFVLENFPFIEADFDAITNYQLLCKVIEYLNNVIANQNTVQDLGSELVGYYNALVDAVNLAINEFETDVTADINQFKVDVNEDFDEFTSNITTQFNNLHDYVENYFANLDVQEEINNKLDAMAQDGSLTELIGEYVQPLINAQNTEITNFENNVTDRLNTQDTFIASVRSGSPLVASSTSGMTDTSRIYVNTTDGNWYYYNGTQWVSGGIYQASKYNYSYINDRVENLDNGKKSIISDWQNGQFSVATQTIDTNYLYRVSNLTAFHLPTGTVINIKSGFKFTPIYTNTNGTFFIAGEKTESYTTTADLPLHFIIARTSENTSEIADIEEFTNAITIKSNISSTLLSNTNNISAISDFYLNINAHYLKELYITGNNLQKEIVVGQIANKFQYTANGKTYIYSTLKLAYSDAPTTWIAHCNFEWNDTDSVIYARTDNNDESLDEFNNKGIYKLISLNDSGVSGYAVIDFSLIEVGTRLFPSTQLNRIYNSLENNPVIYTYLNRKNNYNLHSVGHQGFGVYNYRGNSEEGFIAGAKYGFTDIECDLKKTSDNVFVCNHDATITADNGTVITIADITYSELLNYTFNGSKICSFDTFVKVAKLYGTGIYVDHCTSYLENSTYLPIIANTIIKYKMQDKVTFLISNINTTVITNIRSYFPKARILFVTSNVITETDLNNLETYLNDESEIGVDLLYTNNFNETILNLMNNHYNLQLEFWTVDNISSYKEILLIANGVTSNYFKAIDVL